MTENAIAIFQPVIFNPINKTPEGKKNINKICNCHKFGGRLDPRTGKVIKLEPV